MSNSGQVTDILSRIQEAAHRIERRFAPIQSPEDFTASEEGLDRLDGICMMLIAIGENLKQLDKVTNGEILRCYPEVDWQGAKGIRDIISHHYFYVDTEIIFDVCLEKLPGLIAAIKSMQEQFPDDNP